MIELTIDPDVICREVYGKRNVGFMLASHAAHNAYHLGQIVLMLKLMGEWNEEMKDA